MSILERILYMDRAARERDGFTVAEIASRFEMSGRQVRRDIDYLRDRIDAPLVWNPGRRRYVYEKEFKDLKFADEKALLFLVFARAAATNLAYVPLAESAGLEALRELVPPSLRGLEDKVRYEFPGHEGANDENLIAILSAIRDGRPLAFRYRDASSASSDRAALPRRLVNYAGTWYCLAYDLAKQELRIFKLSRIESLSLAASQGEQPAKGPTETDIDRFLDSSYGMYKGAGSQLARIRFFGKARAIVCSELWHPDQERVEGSDPARGAYVELSVPVSSYEEILGRVLRFGSYAEVLASDEFRELWRSEIRAMAQAL